MLITLLRDHEEKTSSLFHAAIRLSINLMLRTIYYHNIRHRKSKETVRGKFSDYHMPF